MFNINLQEMKTVFDKFNLKDYLVHLQSNSQNYTIQCLDMKKKLKDVCFLQTIIYR